jgi:hypothetical protein
MTFQSMVLQPLPHLLAPGSTAGAAFTLTASAAMRHESQ